MLYIRLRLDIIVAGGYYSRLVRPVAIYRVAQKVNHCHESSLNRIKTFY